MGRTSALVQALILPVMALMCLVIALVSPRLRGYGLEEYVLAMFVGAGLVAASKIPRFRAQDYVSFGPKGLPGWARAIYYAGYALVVVGAAGASALSKSWH